MRRAVVAALGQGGKDDPEILPILKTLAQSDADAAVRHAAVTELLREWNDDPETLLILKAVTQSDMSEWVRRAAMKSPEPSIVTCDLANAFRVRGGLS